MNEARATLAIVRRHIDRRFARDWAIEFVILVALGYPFAHVFGPAGAVCVVGALCAANAAERSHAESLRRLTFFAAPLYGRQLARAHAIAPALGALAIPAGYATGAALRGGALAPAVVATLVLAALVATLVALSSAFRDGLRATLYVVLGLGAAASLALPGLFVPAHALAIAAALALVEGFFALRAFGETLARYDPLPA
jgi:hypothetical protein